VPKSAASVAKVLGNSGYTTFALGKWDHTPFGHISAGGPFTYWPTGEGFDHFYGFMAADSHNFQPVFYDGHQHVVGRSVPTSRPNDPVVPYRLEVDSKTTALRSVMPDCAYLY